MITGTIRKAITNDVIAAASSSAIRYHERGPKIVI
jgi:hypothetical protein